MIVDTRKVECFFAVVHYCNISRAAESLRISQATLSRQIQALEREMKAPLFTRSGKGVAPTEAGLRFQEGLKIIERQLRILRDEVAAAAGEPCGEVALGLPPSPRSILAVPVVGKVRKLYPKIAIQVHEQVSSDIRDRLASGELDLAIVNTYEPLQGLACDRIASEPMLLVGPYDSMLSLDVPTSITAAAELPLVLTMRPNSLRRMVEEEFRRKGMMPRIEIEADTLPLITDLVREGSGFSILPSCSVLPLVRAKSLSASVLEGLRVSWTIARPINRSMSLGAKGVRKVIEEVVSELIESGTWQMAEKEEGRL